MDVNIEEQVNGCVGGVPEYLLIRGRALVVTEVV